MRFPMGLDCFSFFAFRVFSINIRCKFV
jgi:hypothetical protein